MQEGLPPVIESVPTAPLGRVRADCGGAPGHARLNTREARGAAVAQFDGFARAGGRAGGHAGPRPGARRRFPGCPGARPGGCGRSASHQVLRLAPQMTLGAAATPVRGHLPTPSGQQLALPDVLGERYRKGDSGEGCAVVLQQRTYAERIADLPTEASDVPVQALRQPRVQSRQPPGRAASSKPPLPRSLRQATERHEEKHGTTNVGYLLRGPSGSFMGPGSVVLALARRAGMGRGAVPGGVVCHHSTARPSTVVPG
jgi:hypothetical protein